MTPQSNPIPSPNLVKYTYEEMRTDLLSIIKDITSIEKTNTYLGTWTPQIVVGLARGGLVPATMVSHYFNVPLIPVNLSLRDFKSDLEAVEMEIKQTVGVENIMAKRILVVDDIVDSGATMKELSDIFARIRQNPGLGKPKITDCNSKTIDNIKYATLYYNYSNNAEFVPDFYAKQIDKSQSNDWIIFPFENWWE